MCCNMQVQTLQHPTASSPDYEKLRNRNSINTLYYLYYRAWLREWPPQTANTSNINIMGKELMLYFGTAGLAFSCRLEIGSSSQTWKNHQCCSLVKNNSRNNNTLVSVSQIATWTEQAIEVSVEINTLALALWDSFGFHIDKDSSVLH